MRAVVGIGSNLGDRDATIELALDALRKLPFVRSVRASRRYRTAPVGGPPQGEFVNAAALLVVDSEVDAALLVRALLAIEATLGRVRGERFGPRTIDLDLLWTDGPCSDVPEAVVPHPRLSERPFALIPMLELVPDAVDAHGRKFADVLANLDRSGVGAGY